MVREDASGEYAGPSWADWQSLREPTRSPEASRRLRQSRAFWIVLALSILLVLLPWLVFTPPLYRDNRLLVPLPGWFAVWAAAVILGCIEALSRLWRPQAPYTRRIAFLEERALVWTAAFIGFLALLVYPNMRGTASFWLWVCCAVLVGALGASGFRRAARDERSHVAGNLLGAMLALAVTFPTRSMQPFAAIAIVVAMTIFIMVTSERHRETATTKEPTG